MAYSLKMVIGGAEKTAAATLRSRMKGWLHRLLPLLLGGGLLALILSRTNLSGLLHVLSQAQWRWYVLGQLMLAGNLLIITTRWRFNLSLLNVRYPFGELFLIDNAGALAGAATPGRMGDLARLIYFRQNKIGLVRVGLSILVERFLDLISLVWLSAIFIFIFPLPQEIRKLLLYLILGIHFFVLIFAWFAWRFRGKDWVIAQSLRLVPSSLTARYSGHARDLLAALGCYATGWFAWPVILTFLNWGLVILSAEFSSRALGLPLNLWQTAACFCLSTLFTIIPISVAGIGTRELAMVYLFSILGLPSEQALAFSFLLLGFLLMHSLVGFVALLIKPPHSRPQDKIQTALNEEGH